MFFHPDEVAVEGADGDEEFTAVCKFFDERWGDKGCRGCDIDAVVGLVGGKTFGSIACVDCDISDMGLLEVFFCGVGEMGEAFDGMEVAGGADDGGDDGGVVTGAGAYFEDVVAGVEVEGFAHDGNHVRCGDGLS